MAVVEVSAPPKRGLKGDYAYCWLILAEPCEVSFLETGPAERGVAAAPGIRVISMHALCPIRLSSLLALAKEPQVLC